MYIDIHGRTVSKLREIWREWEESGEELQRMQGLETVDGECTERKVRKEKTMKKIMVTMVILTPGGPHWKQVCYCVL